MRFLLAAFAFISCLSGTGLAQNSNLKVRIDNPDFRRLVVASPTMLVQEEGDKEAKALAEEASKYLNSLLDYTGVFNIIPEKAYSDLVSKMLKGGAAARKKFFDSQTGSDFQTVRPADWKALGIESVTMGIVAKEGKNWSITLKTLDILKSKVILGKKFSSVSKDEFYKVMRRYGDQLLEFYTGRKGLFTTKFVFVGRQNKKQAKQIFMCDFDGKNLVRITHDDVPHLSPAWSPDGKYIGFSSFKTGRTEVYLYELSSNKVRKVTQFSDASSGINWSPQADGVAVTRTIVENAEIDFLNPFTGKSLPLVRGHGMDVEPSFSPDGKYFAFVSGRFKNPHIFRAELSWDKQGIPKILNEMRLTFAGWYNATPSWSPDSAKIAFAGYDKDIDRFDLFMMDPDGKNMERLTLKSGDNENPSWSPDGQMIVFHSNRLGNKDVKGQNQLFLMNRDGSQQRMLDLGIYEAEAPRWSAVFPEK